MKKSKYEYNISKDVHDTIYDFYTNVSKKYRHTYSKSLMVKNINDAFNSIYKIEDKLPRRKPILSKWKGLHMAHDGKWYFAYRISGNTIYVEDACHSQNMHEELESLGITLPKSDTISLSDYVKIKLLG